ncbi:MAG: ankyrin repeat domain-containing protein, partial [Planctomycetaceae bacterium]
MSKLWIHHCHWQAGRLAWSLRFLLAVAVLLPGLATAAADEPAEYPVSDKKRAFLSHPEVFFDSPAQQALCRAIQSGDIAAVDKACAAGAEVAAAGRHGVTPLFWAYVSRKFKVFEYLLAKGADPDVPVRLPPGTDVGDLVIQISTGDSTLYMSAKDRLSEQWLRTILKHAKPRRWLHPEHGDNVLHAFFSGRLGGTPQTPETLDQIIKFGVDLDLQGDDGNTPLCYAVSDLHYNLATRLLKAGASAACYDSSDEQIIHTLAQQYKNRQTPGSRSPEDKARW